MKKIRRMVALCLAACAAATFTACGKKDQGTMDGETYVLTIYRSRDSGMTDGNRDDAVREAIETAFYDDTGIKISLNVQLYTNTQIKDVVAVNFGNKNKNIDAIFHYLSEDAGSAITGYAKDSTATIDLDPVLEEYGQNVLAKINENDEDHIADRSGYFNDGGTFHRTALTSYAKEGGYGVLVRKDYMEAVKGITGLDPEDYDIVNEGYKSMTVSEFERVMKAIKENVEDVNISVTGAPWDLQRVVATAFGVNSMSGYGLNENGELVPAQFTPGWDRYVDLMYRWSSSGIWEKESDTTSDDQRQSNFVAGKVAAYVAYPTAEQLIDLSRRVYASDPSAELMVIAPFASEDEKGNCLYNEDGTQVVNGNLKGYRSFYAGIVPYNSSNYEILIRYIDWMYSDPENYELCLYGVKGVDWVDGEDFVYEGKTYRTWRYPDEKADEYLSKPPYTGKYMLLQNVNVSNRISGHYNTVEKTWYTSLYFEFPQFGNTEIEGIWQPQPSRAYATIASSMDGDYVDNIRAYAWAGRTNGGQTPTQLLKQHVETYKASAADYLKYVNDQYVASKEYFAEKYANR